MSSSFGERVRYNIFGQSHGTAIGVTIDGLPAGEAIDIDELRAFLQRRAPGRAAYATKRKEADEPHFLSGVVDGYTCGAPVCVIIQNTSAHSTDYENLRKVPRPGHADYTAMLRDGGHVDLRGGGHFSGRLTAPLCIAGGIAKQILARKGISVGAHIAAIAEVPDKPFNPISVTKEALLATSEAEFPVLDAEAGARMREVIAEAAKDGDSVGGVVECCAIGIEAGTLGRGMFGGIESRLVPVLFGIPAVKGVEFGLGFAAATLRGSQNNDPFTVTDGRVAPLSNNHGGVLGGISSGMPLLFRVAFKPTPSIAKPQQSADMERREPVTLAIEGRHDPCIVPRAVPVVEAAAACILLDMIL